MDQITARTLRNVEWKPVYFYPGAGTFSFTTYASDKLPGLTITKERRGVKRPRLYTIYQFQGRKTDSPTQIVRLWNEAARQAKSGGHMPADSTQSLKRPGMPKGRIRGTGI